jgi:trigger factor
LKIEKELQEDHQIQLNVELDADPFEKAKRQAARKIAKKVKIPGFRPGKAPYNVILRHVGEGAVVEEAMDILIDDIYPKVLDEAEITPYGPGNLEEVESLDPPTFKFMVPLAPEVELGDYKALEIAYEVPKVETEEIDAQIDELRQQQAITEKSEDPAKEGDRVFYQVSADRVEIEEGEEAEIIPNRFNSTIIEAKGEEQNQWPYVGFSQNLLGMSIDEEKDVVYTYPEDHFEEDLQSVEAVFHITVTNVQTVSLPEVDDEFAKTASDFDTIEELRADIEESIKAQKEQEYDSEYNDKVIGSLVEQSTVKFPPQMLENEKKDMISNLEYRLSQQGINHDLYLQIRGITEEEFQEEMEPLAENRIKNGLVLAEVAKLEELEIDQQQLAAETGRTVDIITRGMTPKDAKDFQKSGNLWNLMNNIMADMMTQQSMAYLRAVAKGEPWPPETDDEPETEEGEEASESEVPETETSVEAEAGTEEAPEEEAAPEEVAEPETPEEDETPEAEEKPEPEDAEPASETEENGPESE